MTCDFNFVEGLFWHEGLDEHPGRVGETSSVDDDEPMLSLRTVVERVAEVTFGDGEFEVVGAEVVQIPNDQHLVDVTSHLCPHINFKVVNIVVTVHLNAGKFVHINQCSFT